MFWKSAGLRSYLSNFAKKTRPTISPLYSSVLKSKSAFTKPRIVTGTAVAIGSGTFFYQTMFNTSQVFAQAQDQNPPSSVFFGENDVHRYLSTFHRLLVPNTSDLPPSAEPNYNYQNPLIEWIDISVYQANHPNIEDTARIQLITPNGLGSLFGVWDGHSGDAASNFCSSELFEYLLYAFTKGYTSKLLSSEALVKADDDFLTFAAKDGRWKDGLAGACSVICHVDPNNNHIYTANAGDSRAILIRLKDNTSLPPKKSAWSFSNPVHKKLFNVLELSTEHQIDTNPKEKQRLISEHPDEEDIVVRDRIKGRLQPTRGLGDGAYKRPEFAYEKFSNLNYLKRKSLKWNPPYTTAEHEMSDHTIDDKDAYLILASDGLFQDLTPKQIASRMSDWVNLYSDEGNNPDLRKPKAISAASYLLKQVLLEAARHAPDELELPKDDLARLNWICNVPPSLRRKIHDDTTILVIKLNTKGNLNKNNQLGSNVNNTKASWRPLEEVLTFSPTLKRSLLDRKQSQKWNELASASTQNKSIRAAL